MFSTFQTTTMEARSTHTADGMVESLEARTMLSGKGVVAFEASQSDGAIYMSYAVSPKRPVQHVAAVAMPKALPVRQVSPVFVSSMPRKVSAFGNTLIAA